MQATSKSLTRWTANWTTNSRDAYDAPWRALRVRHRGGPVVIRDEADHEDTAGRKAERLVFDRLRAALPDPTS